MAVAPMTKLEKIPTLQTAIRELCGKQKIQSGKHIKPLTQYCATRLVLEGGFPPEWISPRPPFASIKKSNAIYGLNYAPGQANESEARVLGGIKYKDVDITVLVPGVGPALAISVKNTGNAFRNLTNRMEEALGECTNVHLMYPGFVFGFLHFLRFRTIGDAETPDASFTEKGEPLPAITRYHEVMNSLSGRRLITDPVMRYEAVGLVVYSCDANAGVWKDFPPPSSEVHFSKFFDALYKLYDLRYGYPDPDGSNIRKEWKLSVDIKETVLDKHISFPWTVRGEAE
jgi:hypothetical protein